MVIEHRFIHVIDYEQNRILSRDIPPTFDEYVSELISYINDNQSVRDYKTRSKYTEVISGAIEISKRKDDIEVVQERATSIANRLLMKEVEAQGHIGRLNTQVQKGSLIQALLHDEQAQKYVYLLAKVEHSTFVDDLDFSFKTGFSKDKKTIWKSCLIDLASEDAEEFYAKVYSNTSAKFWSDAFLEFDEMISDESNTLKSFKAIETVLNTNLRGMGTKDHTVIRNGFIAYYKGRDYIDFPEMVNSILGQYEPVDVDDAKITDIREKILQLPGKKGFDQQFNPVSRVINARIRRTYDVYTGIQLRITDAIEDIDNTIIAYRDTDGSQYLRIKTNNEDTFRRFRVPE
ncbi:37-kD nucleoid-associated bacterial protein [uncultured Clostridium sp.]|nr:37-kD nucleoid-associated bacterial protein [uncultured Clostridium sp.]